MTIAQDKQRDPIVELLLTGVVATAEEAEERYLDAHIPEIIQLVQSPLSDVEFRRQPIIQLLFAHGSRGREDSLW